MYRKILQDPLRFPEEVGPQARSLLTLLLNRDPAQRLGVNGAQDIKNHPFFAKHIDWKRLMAKKIQPPFKPAVVSRKRGDSTYLTPYGRGLLTLRPVPLIHRILTKSSRQRYHSIPSSMTRISRRRSNNNCEHVDLFFSPLQQR